MKDKRVLKIHASDTVKLPEVDKNWLKGDW